MKEEPDIIKQLKNEEKLGKIEGKAQNTYEQVVPFESSTMNISEGEKGFPKKEVNKKTKRGDIKHGGEIQKDLMKLRLIISSMDDLVFVLDKNGIFTDYFQPSKIPDLYVPPEKFIGKSFRKILPPSVVKLFDGAINVMLTTNSSQQFDYCLELKGDVRWFNAKVSMWKDNSGRFLGTVAVVRDITERKQAEEALQKSEGRYRVSIELTQLLAWTTNSSGEVVEDILVWRKFTGQNYEEVKGTGWAKALHPDDLEHTIQAWKKAVETKATYETEYRIRRFDGVYRNFLTRGIPVLKEDGSILEWIGICIDITERKLTEQSRLLSLEHQERLSQLKQALLASGDLTQKLKTITDGVVDIFAADFCRIWVIGQGDLCEQGCMHAAATEGPHVCRERDKCLQLMASSGRYTHTDGVVHRRVPFGAYKIGRVASGQEHKFLTNDAANDPRVHNHDWVKELGLVSFAGYQLRPPGGKTLGVLALFSKHSITPEEDAQLDALSSTTALVIHATHVAETLHESEEKYRTLLETTDTGFCILDLQGNILDANSEYVRLSGHSTLKEIMGRRVVEWMAEYDLQRNAEEVKKCIQQGFVRNLEIDYVDKHGKTTPIEINATVIQTDKGQRILILCRDITGRKLLEHENKENMERLFIVIERIGEGITFSDKAGHFEVFNSKMQEITGYSMKEANDCKDFTTLSYLDPKERQKALEGLTEIIEKGIPKEIETTIQTKDGKKKILMISTSLVRYKNRNMFLTVYHDITKRKQAEEEIQQSYQIQTVLNELLRISLENIPLEKMLERIIDHVLFIPWLTVESKGAIFLTEDDPEILVMKVNKRMAQPLQTICARVPFGRCLCGRAAKSGKVEFADNVDERHQNQYEGIAQHGHYCIPILSSSKKVIGVVNFYVKEGHQRNKKEEELLLSVANLLAGTIERKQTEKEIKEREERYHALYEGMRDGYVMTDMNDKIVEYNSFFKKMLGYTDEELQGKKYIEIIPKEWQSKVATIVEEQVLKRGYSNVFEKEFIKKDGRIIPVEVRRYLLQKEGKPIGMWSFVRDITDRKQTEDELKRKIDALERYKNVTVGRELRMIELKKQTKEFEEKMKNTR